VAVVLGSTLTTAQTVTLLESEHLFVDAGLELLDADDVLIQDITSDLIADGSSVSRGIYNTIHGTCRLRISRELQWGWQRLRPFLLASSDDVTYYRFNLGVFLPATPERMVGESPVVYDVDGFDKLDVLNAPIGSSISVASGAAIVDAVESLISGAGEAKVNIDPSAEVTTSDRVYSLTEDWTTLTVCNDLLASIGYQALWADRDGWFRSTPYVSPADRATVWTYDADSASSTVGESRSSVQDYYRAANRIVAINDDPTNDVPVVGDGIYTVSNQSDGLTSIDARGGRIITRIVRGSYASQAALETAATEALDTEKRVANYVTLSVAPNPTHRHFDVVRLIDSALPVDGRFIVTDWELPLSGEDMRLSLRGV